MLVKQPLQSVATLSNKFWGTPWNEFQKKKKKSFPLWEQTDLNCTGSIKECLKAVIVLERNQRRYKKREKRGGEKGGEVS